MSLLYLKKLTISYNHLLNRPYSNCSDCFENVILELVYLNEEPNQVHTLHLVDMTSLSLKQFPDLALCFQVIYLLNKTDHLSCSISQFLHLLMLSLVVTVNLLLQQTPYFLYPGHQILKLDQSGIWCFGKKTSLMVLHASYHTALRVT